MKKIEVKIGEKTLGKMRWLKAYRADGHSFEEAVIEWNRLNPSDPWYKKLPADPKQELKELKELKEFYKTIAKLTLNHEIIDDTACVTADKLGEALEKINKEWWKEIK